MSPFWSAKGVEIPVSGALFFFKISSDKQVSLSASQLSISIFWSEGICIFLFFYFPQPFPPSSPPFLPPLVRPSSPHLLSPSFRSEGICIKKTRNRHFRACGHTLPLLLPHHLQYFMPRKDEIDCPFGKGTEEVILVEKLYVEREQREQYF